MTAKESGNLTDKVNGADVLLHLSGITKRFGRIVANDGVDLTIRKGEIHSILGENGAGKSTLMKMIFGVEIPDEGQIHWKGQEVTIKNPGHAREMGLGMVFQHFTLFETVRVVDNISLTVPGTVAELSAKIRQVSEELGLPLNPDAMVHTLSVGEKQRVEIFRCLLQEPELIILDEPTAVLPPPNVAHLFKTLRRLADKGVAILFISHKLEEIRDLCHSATILRHGQVTGHVDPTVETTEELARLMIGRDIPHADHEEAPETGEVRLNVKNLTVQNLDPMAVSIEHANFQVRSGEIVGIAGVSGNGQQLLENLLSGEVTVPTVKNGTIEMLGQLVSHLGVNERRELGMSYVPEERIGRGAVPELSLSKNALLTAHRLGMVKHGLIQEDACGAFAAQCIEDMDVRCQGKDAVAGSLSGGNLQKFIIGREMMLAPKVLIVAQPTWGIDVGAAAMVRQKLVDLREAGTAILVISEELEELFEISDRMIVISGGRISHSVRTRDTHAEEIGQMMIGQFGEGQSRGVSQ